MPEVVAASSCSLFAEFSSCVESTAIREAFEQYQQELKPKRIETRRLSRAVANLLIRLGEFDDECAAAQLLTLLT